MLRNNINFGGGITEIVILDAVLIEFSNTGFRGEVFSPFVDFGRILFGIFDGKSMFLNTFPGEFIKEYSLRVNFRDFPPIFFLEN